MKRTYEKKNKLLSVRGARDVIRLAHCYTEASVIEWLPKNIKIWKEWLSKWWYSNKVNHVSNLEPKWFAKTFWNPSIQSMFHVIDFFTWTFPKKIGRFVSHISRETEKCHTFFVVVPYLLYIYYLYYTRKNKYDNQK